MSDLAEAGAALLGQPLGRVLAWHGGSLSQVVHVALADGSESIVKNGPSPMTEAAMLRAIAESGAPAPRVLAANRDLLVMTLVPGGGSLSGAWGDLGTSLARLHRAEGPHYGWEKDYAFGAVAIENGWSEDWPEFWGQRRLLTHAAHIPSDLSSRIERLAADLSNRLPQRPRPALLHGDLWGGNVLAARGRISGLIDPACYYGHREVDLAMLGLFDSPSAAFFDAYGPLEPGHVERRPIYALWPALVHFRLFGSGYRAMVEQKLAAAGA